MSTTASDLPPFEPQRILSAPFPERVRLSCLGWAKEGSYQPSVMALYWAKYLFFYIAGWAVWVSFNDGYPGIGSPLEWAFTGDAFKKAMAWSIFYELAGFGCGWGPMNARIKPMFGGCRHFLRPGTTKLPLFRNAPLVGGDTRTWLDVALYAITQLLLLRVLFAGEVTSDLLWPIFLLIPVLGVLDTTLFLAARAEHYWVALACLTFASGGLWGLAPTGQEDLWISGCKVVWAFIWWWAAVSKVNSHFPSVIMFMMNNGPFFPRFLKLRLFSSFPDDMRASRFAAIVSHFGAATEAMIPFILIFSPNDTVTLLGCLLATGFHTFIGLNNPNGMPVEWNILMIYGVWAIFFFHPEASAFAMGSAPLLLAFMLFWLAAVPTFGNLVPARVSFLLSMRYYAGNWAYNIWLIKKGETAEKLKKLKKAGGTFFEQLADVLPDQQTLEVAKASMVVSRFMHFQGRPLLEALPTAVDDVDDYDWYEGEVLGGTILGWNFGDGHLNGIHLLNAVQGQCGFEPGEVRLVSVESQPLFGPTMHWTTYDAATGKLAEGRTVMKEMAHLQPWPTGQYAEALERGGETGGG